MAKSWRDIQNQRERIINALEDRRIANFGTAEGSRIANRMDRVRRIGDKYIRNIENTKSWRNSSARRADKYGNGSYLPTKEQNEFVAMRNAQRDKKYSTRTYMGATKG